MSDSASKASSQVDRNFTAFKNRLPELLATHAGKLAVLHEGDVVEFFDSYADAVRFGLEKYSAFGNFSVQEVSNTARSMGYYSYAGDFHK